MKNQETINKESGYTYGHKRDEKLGEEDVVVVATDLTNNTSYHWIWNRSQLNSTKHVNLSEYAPMIANGLRVINHPDLAHISEKQKAEQLGSNKVLPYVASSKSYEMMTQTMGHNTIYIAVDYKGNNTAVRLVGSVSSENVDDAVGDNWSKAYQMSIMAGHIKRKGTRLTLMDVITPGTRVTRVSNYTPKKKKRK